MSKTTVPLLEVTVRRDANTITPVTVAPYELTILKNMFGKENVTEGDAVGVIEVEAEAEHERLAAKYGFEKVAKVYGDDDGERLAELVQKAAVRAERASAKRAEKSEKADAPEV